MREKVSKLYVQLKARGEVKCAGGNAGRRQPFSKMAAPTPKLHGLFTTLCGSVVNSIFISWCGVCVYFDERRRAFSTLTHPDFISLFCRRRRGQ